MSANRNNLHEIADELRGRPFDTSLILKTAKSRGITFDLEDVNLLLTRDIKSDLFCCPHFIQKFIQNYFEGNSINSILDPSAGIGSLLAPIVHELAPKQAIALEINQEAHEIASLIGHESGIEWRLGSPLHLLDDIEQEFDIVLGSPPWNLKRESLTFSLDDTNIEIRDDADKLIILKSSLLMAPEGAGFFITSPNFTFKLLKNGVYKNLSRFNLFVDTILSLPNGIFPVTSLGGLLVIIRKQKPDKIFVGELSSNESSNNVLLKNLKARIEGKVPQHGILVKKEEFTSFQSLVFEYGFKELGRQLGLPATSINDLALEKNLAKSSFPKGFLDHTNALYLPRIGRSHAIASLADLQLKPHNYIQIVLDQEKVNAEYLAHFFNTTLGQKIRESLQNGAVIPKINKSQLNKAMVYIPELSTQIEVRQVDATIENISSDLEILKRQLWEQPKHAQKIQKLVNSLNTNENFENWLDILPFPLASILWAYHAEDNPKEKLTYLLHFFEALAQFNTILMLSAYASEPDFILKHSNKLFKISQKWFNHVTFGKWCYLGEMLAKETRDFLDDKNTKNQCRKMFGNPTQDFIDMLINEKLYDILKIAKDYRNKWRGHVGAESTSDAKERLDLLELELAATRKLVTDSYSTAFLLRPDINKPTDGIFHNRTDALIGRSTPFKKLLKKTTSVMYSNKLYMLHEDQIEPVELLPFIKVEKNNACYFFSRIEKNNNANYVSYHFEQESSLDIPLDKLESTFEKLFPDVKFASGKECGVASGD